jgi:hypothetical protein
VIAALRLEAARRHPWLRAAYYHADMVRRTLADPEVGADANVDFGDAVLDGPDAVIGGHYAVDVIPDTPVSRRAHLQRDYIGHDDQLIVYPPATPDFLAEIFRS